jgi:inner membrane protein
MDVVSHGLASYALTRAIFPRISRVGLAGVILAGIAADVDALSAQFGPSAFLQWHRTYLHSVVAAVLIALLASAAVLIILRRRQNQDAFATILVAALGASLLHVAMDFCQNDQIQILWPFRAQRYSSDFLPHFDLWILLILLAGALLPQLLGLVTEEIGAKSKAPRGRVGAVLALAFVVSYVGARFVLHGNVVAMMDSRTYRRESARRIAALAESDSPLHWHGIVETERALHDLEVNLGPGGSFDPEGGLVSYKPEPSPLLDAAGKTDAARRFLQAARFPKASVEKTVDGYRVEIREFSYQREAHTRRHVMVVVETDANASVTSQEIVWEADRIRVSDASRPPL